jgi:hypothetical protein
MIASPAASSPFDSPNTQNECHLFNDLLGKQTEGSSYAQYRRRSCFFFLFFKLPRSERVSIVYSRLIYLLGNKPFYSYYLGND